MDTLNLLTCDIRDLNRLADRHGIPRYLGAGDRLVIRPYRGPRVDVRDACVTRHDELRDHLMKTRSAPFDPAAAADDAAWRVCGIPYQVLIALAMYDLNTRLAQAEAGLLAYVPPEPPQWDDGIAQDDQRERSPQVPALSQRKGWVEL